MADRSRWWQAALPRWAKNKSLATTGEILRRGAPPVSASPAPAPAAPPSTTEHGVAGTQVFGGTILGEEYNADLIGQKGLATYNKMRRSDAQVRASLQAMKLPLLSAVWEAKPPAGGDAVDEAIADFVHNTLFDDDAMDDTWNFVLKHILLQLDFGFSVCEHVFRTDARGFYRLKRLAPRLPQTVHFWHLTRDGKLVRVWQYAPEIVDDPRRLSPMTTRGIPMPPQSTYRYIAIPGDILSVFTLDREGDNLEGISMLRSAYKHYWYKDLIYHLDGVRLDRYGVGIPVAELSEGHGLSGEDLDDLEDVLKNLRANERVFLIAPPNVRYRIMGPEAGGGASVNAAPIIEHHNTMIARNILAGFLTMGTDPRGTLGFGSRLADLFVSSLYGVASGIAGDLKKTVVKRLCDLNFDMRNRQYPSLSVRDLESADIERLIKVLAAGVGTTLITPDDELEKTLRKSLRVSALPSEQTREAKARAAGQAQAAGQPVPGQPGQPAPAPSPSPSPSATDLMDLLKAEHARPLQFTLQMPDGNGKGKRVVTTAVTRDDRGLIATKTDTIVEE